MSSVSQKIASAYGRCVSDYDQQVPFFVQMGERLVDVLDPGPGERVLDVACGRGACLLPAAERVGPAGRVHGIDLSEEMVEHLRADIEARGLSQASVQRMDAHDLSLSPGSHDAVTCSYALFLMEDPERVAAGLVRMLRPGGRMAVSVPASRLLPGDEGVVGGLFTTYAEWAGLGGERTMDFGMDVGSLLMSAGAVGVRVFDEERTFWFESIESWWQWTWTASPRTLYEALPGPQVRRLREQLFEALEPALTPEGLPARARCRFATATRS